MEDQAHEPTLQPKRATQLLQEWEGRVVEIAYDEFIAELIDLTAGSSYAEEEAVIPLAQIADDDAGALQVGGVFRWTICHEGPPSVRKKLVSRIVFCKSQVFTQQDLERAQQWAAEVRRAFNLSAETMSQRRQDHDFGTAVQNGGPW